MAGLQNQILRGRLYTRGLYRLCSLLAAVLFAAASFAELPRVLAAAATALPAACQDAAASFADLPRVLAAAATALPAACQAAAASGQASFVNAGRTID